MNRSRSCGPGNEPNGKFILHSREPKWPGDRLVTADDQGVAVGTPADLPATDVFYAYATDGPEQITPFKPIMHLPSLNLRLDLAPDPGASILRTVTPSVSEMVRHSNETFHCHPVRDHLFNGSTSQGAMVIFLLGPVRP